MFLLLGNEREGKKSFESWLIDQEIFSNFRAPFARYDRRE